MKRTLTYTFTQEEDGGRVSVRVHLDPPVDDAGKVSGKLGNIAILVTISLLKAAFGGDISAITSNVSEEQ